MFRIEQNQSTPARAFRLLELIYHATVRNVRKSHGSAVMGLVMHLIQSIMMVLIFLFVFNLMGRGVAAIRGDILVYIMSGIFMFMTHVKAISAVSGADGPTSAMMKHAPMNPIISIAAAALAVLYLQILAALIILFFYDAVFAPITIDEPYQTFGMFLLSWATGVGIGMIFLSAKPWAPGFIGLFCTLFQRANMIASGKMFVANTLKPKMLALFDWNPLFHTIDQGRGFIFLNYTPRYTNYIYPLKVLAVCVLIGLMLEFVTRKYASASWNT
jgi:ABC-type polysaccharide/polyol phosphate export permease